MTFLNFSQFSESVFRPNFPGKHFPNNKQTQENLKNNFSKNKF
jgi:hypothetical protein